MYRENSVERKPGQICVHHARRMSICGKTAEGEKRFFVLLPLCFWLASFL